MGDRGGYQRGTRVYVGGLSQGTKKEDLETEFEKFGKLNNVWVAFNPPGFAFIEFSNKTDAENACDSMNGTELLGGKLRVELSRSRGRGGFRGNGGGRGRGGSRGGNGPPVMGFGGRGRGGARSAGGRGGGGPRRGGFGRGRDFSRNGGRDNYVGGGVGVGGGGGGGGGGVGVYGGGNGTYGVSRNTFNGGDGASSRYRSRSPISAGGGANRRY